MTPRIGIGKHCRKRKGGLTPARRRSSIGKLLKRTFGNDSNENQDSLLRIIQYLIVNDPRGSFAEYFTPEFLLIFNYFSLIINIGIY